MYSRITRKMWSTINCGLINLSDEYKAEYQDEQVEHNLLFDKYFVSILLVLNIIMLVINKINYSGYWDSQYAYRNLFNTNITAVVVLPVFLFMMEMRKRKHFEGKYSDKLLYIGISISILFWSAYISANAQLISGQISTYIIGMFLISSCLILHPIESLIVFGSAHIFFISGSFQMMDGNLSMSNIINSTFLAIVAYGVSGLNYSYRVRNFVNMKAAEQKAYELDSIKNQLEDTVKYKTQKLIEANQRLIDEINTRHAVEMDTIKHKLLSEQKTRLLKEAVEYENLRTDFFANISHELRTPLNLIFSSQQMLDLILKSYPYADKKTEVDRYIHIISQNCNRLTRLIANIIDMTKIDAGKLEIHLQNCDIVCVVEDITQSAAEYIKSKHLNLIFDTEIEEKVIACDPEKIERIMLNLLSNAVKFTPEGGTIFVYIHEKENKFLISVKDTGIGIPAEMQGIIFDRFVRVDKPLVRRREGSGIGLSLVKSLIEMHNGSISVVSEYGKGSEFIIELPDYKIQEQDKTQYKGREISQQVNIELSDI